MTEYDKRMKNAGGSVRQGGDLDLLKDSVKYHPINLKKAKGKGKVNSVNA